MESKLFVNFTGAFGSDSVVRMSIFNLCVIIFLMVSCATVPPKEPKTPINETVTKIMFLKLNINNKSCYQYLLNTKFDDQPILAKLDTGSNITMIPESNFFKNYPTQRTFNVQGSAKIPIKASSININHIELGGFTSELKEVIRNPVVSAPATIGINALNMQPFGFDFPRKHLLLNPPLPTGNMPNLTIAKDGRLLIEIEFNGEQYSTMVDTGYCTTVVDSSVIRQHPDNFVFKKYGEVVDPTGHFKKFRFFHMKTFTFPGFRLSNVLVAEDDLSGYATSLGQPISFILGVDHMVMAKWYFDPANKKWAASL